MLAFPAPAFQSPETETLLTSLNEQRALILWKLENLAEDQRATSPVDSGTTLLGVVKHLAWVERWWFTDFIAKQTVDYPWTEEDPDADFRIEDDDSIASISELYASAVADANAVIAAQESWDVTGTVRGTDRSLRWVIVHMIEETSRHLGHMDIIREQLDGLVGYTPRN